jgi:hypothetical protein
MSGSPHGVFGATYVDFGTWNVAAAAGACAETGASEGATHAIAAASAAAEIRQRWLILI